MPTSICLNTNPGKAWCSLLLPQYSQHNYRYSTALPQGGAVTGFTQLALHSLAPVNMCGITLENVTVCHGIFLNRKTCPVPQEAGGKSKLLLLLKLKTEKKTSEVLTPSTLEYPDHWNP